MNIIRSVDIFDKYISLKYNNESKYRTICGGLLTILIFILMVVYFALIIANSDEKTSSVLVSSSTGSSNTSQIIGDTEFNSSIDFRTYNSYKTMTENTIEYNLTEGGWAVALMVSKLYNASLYDIHFYSYVKSSAEENREFLDFSLTLCTEANFPIHLLENYTNQEYMLSRMLCPDYTSANVSLMANLFSGRYKVLQIELVRCSNQDYCVDDATIDSEMQYNQVNLITANSYYDHNDLTNPIKYTLDISPGTYVEVNFYKHFSVPIVPTTINFLNGTSTTIFETKQKEMLFSIELPSNIIISYSLIISSEQYTIEQQTNYQPVSNARRMLDTTQTEIKEEEDNDAFYNLFFILSQLGGFYSFLQLILSPFVNKIYQSMLMVDLVNKLKENETKSKLNKSISVRSRRQHAEEQKRPSRSQINHQTNLIHEGGNEDVNEDRYSQVHDNDDLMESHTYERSRLRSDSLYEQKTVYSYWDGIRYSLSCKTNSSGQDQIEKIKLKQFETDLQKLNLEIDIMKIVQSIKDTKTAMNKMMKYMINIQKSTYSNQNRNDESKIEEDTPHQDSSHHQELNIHQKHSIRKTADNSSTSNLTMHQNKRILVTQKAKKFVSKRQNEEWHKFKSLPVQNIDKNVVPSEPVRNINNII